MRLSNSHFLSVFAGLLLLLAGWAHAQQESEPPRKAVAALFAPNQKEARSPADFDMAAYLAQLRWPVWFLERSEVQE